MTAQKLSVSVSRLHVLILYRFGGPPRHLAIISMNALHPTTVSVIHSGNRIGLEFVLDGFPLVFDTMKALRYLQMGVVNGH